MKISSEQKHNLHSKNAFYNDVSLVLLRIVNPHDIKRVKQQTKLFLRLNFNKMCNVYSSVMLPAKRYCMCLRVSETGNKMNSCC